MKDEVFKIIMSSLSQPLVSRPPYVGDQLENLHEEEKTAKFKVREDEEGKFTLEIKETSDDDFDPEQLALGTKIELEHTDNEDLAKAIAKDHLKEKKDYYTNLLRYVEND